MLQSMGSQRVGHDWAIEHTHRPFSGLGFGLRTYFSWFAHLSDHYSFLWISNRAVLLSCSCIHQSSVQFSSVAQLCQTLFDPMDCSTPGFPVHHQLPKLAQTHVHQVSDATQLSHCLSTPSPPAFNLFQHQGLFQGINSSYQVAKVLEFHLQHQSFQWIFKTDFL